MAKLHIGCQTITYGEDQNVRFREIFSELAGFGYAGVEIGYRRLEPVAPNAVNEMLRDAGIRLVASHIGGNLEDPDQADRERSVLDAVIDYLHAAGVGLLMYSGLKYQDAKQLREDVEALNRAAETCAENGIRLLYHNHDWETRDDGVVYAALVRDGSPDLGFCPDVGWLYKSGADPIAVMDSVRSRIGLVHMKDFASLEPGVDTVEFGTGIVPLQEIARWMMRNLDGIWVMAEQDRSSLPAREAVKKNGEYLFSLFPGS